MKEPDIATNAAWDNLNAALEMLEGELWRNPKITSGWTICYLQQARRLLDRGRDRFNMEPQS